MQTYTANGDPISREEIDRAVEERRAVIVWSHCDGYNLASLAISETAEEASIYADRDTRNQCYSMWEEAWCELATDPLRAHRAAAGLLKTS